ncbi:DUF6262 family protein [Nocardia araoensis]|uniref:DUF6262 family protein n=1 Tax=Nocardia araoensis TaxID=228600 RepID=UPI001FDF2A19|nr:DUF6262 family protein [Nocardia araoensis]
MPPNPMIEGRRADSDRRRQRVIKAINAAQTNGGELNVSAIARTARVDRTFLYRHRDLLAQIHTAQRTPPTVDNATLVTAASLKTDLANAQARMPDWPATTSSWKGNYRNYSVNEPGTNPGSAHRPTSTRCSGKSSPSSRRSSDYAPSSKNGTRNSTRPGPPTVNCSRT